MRHGVWLTTTAPNLIESERDRPPAVRSCHSSQSIAPACTSRTARLVGGKPDTGSPPEVGPRNSVVVLGSVANQVDTSEWLSNLV
jgi:hypothetical protein